MDSPPTPTYRGKEETFGFHASGKAAFEIHRAIPSPAYPNEESDRQAKPTSLDVGIDHHILSAEEMKLAAIILLVATLPMPIFAKDTKEQAFWKWFEKNQEDLYHFEKDREAVFDRLSAAMGMVHKDLTFEFSPVREDGTREFVISAGGIKAAFPSVEALHASAPKLPKWKILKFRQRRFPINDIEFAGRKVKSADVHYAIFKDEDPKKVGIMIFLDGYTDADKGSVWGQIGYLLLDEALGEYAMETQVGAIVFFDRSSRYFEHARPLAELPNHFDETLGRQTNSEQGDGGQPANRPESK